MIPDTTVLNYKGEDVYQMSEDRKIEVIKELMDDRFDLMSKVVVPLGVMRRAIEEHTEKSFLKIDMYNL